MATPKMHIPIGDCYGPRFLQVAGNLQTPVANPNGEVDFIPSRMEVYTGSVGVSGYHMGDVLSRLEVVTFLPFEDLKLRLYDAASILDHTVMVTPETVALEEEDALFGIDTVSSLKLEPQLFKGLPGQQFVLVMRLTLAGLNAHMHSFTYQATILANEQLPVSDSDPFGRLTEPA
jgi:hypothetical protein